MLAKKNRLLTRYQYNIVRHVSKRTSTSFSGRYFFLSYIRPRTYEGPSQVGVVISTKFDKRSTVRNKVKRIFRECIRSNFNQIPVGLWLVFYPRKQAISASYEAICTEIDRALQTISISR